MRAIYLENIELSNEIILTDEKFHHLIKVLRLKRDYEILVLDGIGNSRVYKLNEVNKKSCVIASSSEATTGQRCSTPDVLICPPKKEYAEAMIRSCIEAGVNNIYFAESEYSQWSFENNKRIEQIVSSSLEQSNNHFRPDFIILDDITAAPFKNYDTVLLFTSNSRKTVSKNTLGSCLIIIGPEAGFSNKEEDFVEQLDNSVMLHLPLNIMKAVTALPVAIGYCLGTESNS
ncbi:RsmE family RNA methyltransferase [Bacteriovoracaceae bacterium]|nr:RsmE family RNA methyltransferase [Bacteriovoracaceae bacterium]